MIVFRELTPRDKVDIDEFRQTTGTNLVEVDRYLSGEWEWHELWDYNFGLVAPSSTNCNCKYEGIKASGRRKGYPRSIQGLENLGFSFTLIRGGGSWYVDAYYQCSCGQKWKEVFVEAMQYSGNHAYAISDDEFNSSD
ncbi:hypothetical protein [Vibrio vulnificus]|uniref:hypothetical protein n=1 Tax=Vibrio vulnificus TaxID=672 RepID=UPI0005F0E315|nr:hypothetical protein [Vibrio vulnificus]EGQ9294333.1 hypothetical protein [Vibrio vulnificus]ELP1878813.1 hypothetical protein [Vibrio vulnificus]MCA3912770.1 hypothetical protein [Vibrio vulnificus]MCG9655914.1 hypothetical protein [Vibrio vulnificus]HAS8120102.1 hypothetical protein [Vibrio vulnificus]